jgi:hypothetical protein
VLSTISKTLKSQNNMRVYNRFIDGARRLRAVGTTVANDKLQQIKDTVRMMGDDFIACFERELR